MANSSHYQSMADNHSPEKDTENTHGTKKAGKKSKKHDDKDVEKEEPEPDYEAIDRKNRSKIEALRKQMQRVYNRLEFNQHLNNKKALFINMRNYYKDCCDNEDVFDTLPLTFHVKDGVHDP